MNKFYKNNAIPWLGLSIWLIAALFFLYEFFLRTFVGTLSHQIIPDLKLNAETFATIGAGYYFSYALMQIPVGLLTDRFGVKKIMIFATLTCCLSTFFFAHSIGFFSAFLSRLLMGFGSSFAFICLLVIAARWLPKKYFALIAGISQFIGTLGPLLSGGPLVALLEKSHGNWRLTLTEIGTFGIILAIAIFLLVKNKPDHKERTLIHLQKTTKITTVIKNLMRNKQAWMIALYSACIYISMALLGAIWGVEYLQTRGLSQNAAAGIISVAWLGYAIGCPLTGALSDLIRRRKPILMLSAILGLIATLGIVYLPTQSNFIYSILFFALGLAASGQNIGFATIVEQVPPQSKAAALGLNNGLITLMSGLIPPLLSVFISLSAKHHSGDFIVNDFTRSFAIMPLLYSAALMIATLWVKETFCKPQKEAIKIHLGAATDS